HAHISFKEKYEKLRKITSAEKGTAIAEIGIIPDADSLKSDKIPWLWYMTWSKVFALTQEFNSFDALRKLYNTNYAITSEKIKNEKN
ncbi:MAG: hypothetical protein IJ937_08610, partial [Treponema sp.]|nr:hypothetical protein [Treponema sp.]